MKKSNLGFISPPVLIISSAFIIVIYALLLVLVLQFDFSHRQIASDQALNIAEAGIDYYRWHLSHSPYDFQDGTQTEGPYLHDYHDPSGSSLGQFSLQITPPGDQSSNVVIRSTGWTDQYPRVKRTIKAEFAVPSLSQYTILSNASSWYKEGTTVQGMIHSNNGIRMDGINTSMITSTQETYMCGQETGCHPPETKPGIWGSGPGQNQGLWVFPVPPVDFDSISYDFNQMRDKAQSDGLYLEETKKKGYHLVFQSDGSIEVYKVNRTSYLYGYAVPGHGLGGPGQPCNKQYQIIEDQELINTFQIADNSIIFAEDHLWVEGTVRGRVTVVALNFPIESSKVDIWIPNSLTYTAYDGTDALGLLTQNNIYFMRNIPEDFRIDGALVSQKGNVMRHGYLSDCGPSSEALKDKLTIYGSLSSYYPSYWNFGEGPESGFLEVEILLDPYLFSQPPPYFPGSGQYELISWTEE